MSFFDKLRSQVKEEEARKKKKEGKKAKRPQIEKTEIKSEAEKKAEKKEEKTQTGGQLTLDVYETKDDFIIQSTVAGVKPENLDISVEEDLISIKGTRQRITQEQEGKYLYQECYWGEFSREVILPEEVDASKAQAKIKDGILTLKIPKARKAKRRKINVISSE